METKSTFESNNVFILTIKIRMNFQQYANYYGSFHGATETEIIENCIVFKIDKVSWCKSVVLKLKNYEKAYDDSEKNSDNIKPLSKSLMKHLKLETPCTVFQTDDSFSILYGNTYLLYPKSNGSIIFVATQYFVSDAHVFQKFMSQYNAECVSENIYYYKSAVIFMDEFDIPYPGCNYFSKNNKKNAIGRICFILDQQDTFRIPKFIRNLENVNDIHYKALQTKCINTSISKFIDPIPIDEMYIPTSHYDYTNIVVKRLCYKNPNFIIQDILNSCYINKDIGIVIEYPICLSYVSINKSQYPRRYYCFAINCHQPNQFIHIPSPYDRFYKYDHGIKDINWTSLYYNPIAINHKTDIFDVVIDTNTLGYVYRDTFFCLSHPKLSKVPNVRNRNTRFLLNTLSFNIENDPNMNIVYMHRFDSEFIVYCVKHRDLPYDMFCLEKSKHFTNTYKIIQLPYLVRNWATLVLENQNRTQLNFGDLNFIKLMYILARHKICFKNREHTEREIIYEKQNDIIFQVEKNAIDFINNMKLDFMSQKKIEKEESSNCSLS